MDRPYYMAEDCPQCGQQDAEGKWRGARMSSSEWGHSFSCCSDACGFAYAKNPDRFEREKEIVRQKIRTLLDELEGISERLAEARVQQSRTV